METTKQLILKSIFEQRLLTIKNMHEFNADVVFHIGGKLKITVATFKELVTWHGANPVTPETQPMIDHAIEGTKEMFQAEKVAENIDAIGLKLTRKAYNRLLQEFDRQEVTPILKLVSIHSAADRLYETYDSELEEHKFLWLESRDAEKYADSDPFKLVDHPVLNKCVSDSVCASKCLAFGQQTACVFHLMRILEFSSQEIGRKLGIQPMHKNNPVAIEDAQWGQILDLIENQVRDYGNKKNLSGISQFIQNDSGTYEQLIYQFRAVKKIWRNPVAHPHLFIGTDPNNPDEGWKVFDAVRLFIDQLKPLLP